MNPEELNRRVAKFKARRGKTRAAYYASFISLFLLLSSFARGVNLTATISFLTILPIPLYFVLQSIKLSKKNYLLKDQSQIILSVFDRGNSHFSLGKFITQPNLSFRLSLALLLIVFFTTLARTHTENSSLTYNAQQVNLTSN